MSVIATTRQASAAELAAEMDRRGKVIVALENEIARAEAYLVRFVRLFSKENHGWDLPKLHRLRDEVLTSSQDLLP